MKEKIELTAHFSKTVESRKIKGFASMNNRDRHDHIIPPEAFDIDRFMNNPQLKYNHSYYKDEFGNNIPIGKVLEAQVAMVVDDGDENFWGILDEETGTIIDTFEKTASPDCYPGCRGLWIKAEVTVEKVWQQILDGDFNAFSWEGFARFARVAFAGVKRIIAKYIDLYECSCVYIPDNYAATFVLSKSNDNSSAVTKHVDASVFANVAEGSKLDTMTPYQVRFSKEIFSTEEMANQWLIEKGLEGTTFTEEHGEFVATIFDGDMTDTRYTMQFATGIQLVSGFAKESVGEVSAELELMQLTKALMEDNPMSKEQEEANLQKATDIKNPVSEVQPDGGDKDLSTNPTTQAPANRDNGGLDSPQAATPAPGAGDTVAKTGGSNTPAMQDDNGVMKQSATPKTGAGSTALPAQSSEVPLDPAPMKGVKNVDEEKKEEEEVTPTEESVEEANLDETAQVEKGVKEELDDIKSSKWNRLAGIRKAMDAFEEAAWKEENAPEALKALVMEFAEVAMAEAQMIKNVDAEDKTPEQKALDQIADRATANVMEALAPKFEEIVSMVKSLQPSEEEVKAEEVETEETVEEVKEEVKEEETVTITKTVEEEETAVLKKTVESLQAELIQVKKSVASPSIERQEDTAVMSKSAEKATDPNDVFGSVDGWNAAFNVK